MKACKLLLGVAALALSLQAEANIIVSLEPSSASISSGTPVSVDLVISGLGDHTSPSLGAFDLDLSYDPSILSAVSVTFGTQLDLGILGSIRNSDLSTPGTIHLDEVSLEGTNGLRANQPSSFTLATLGFSGVGAGISAIGFAAGSLSDETGQISLQFSTTPGQVEVTGGTVIVPDVTSTRCSLALGLLSLFALGAQNRKKSRRTNADCI